MTKRKSRQWNSKIQVLDNLGGHIVSIGQIPDGPSHIISPNQILDNRNDRIGAISQIPNVQ